MQVTKFVPVENFDNFTFRCSSLGLIMTNAKGKSPKQKYLDALEKHKKKVNEYSNTSTSAVKTAEKLKLEIEKLEKEMDKWRPLQDTPWLSQTCKTHLCKIYTEATSGRVQDIKSKYMEKGLCVEEAAITQYSLLTGKYFEKNKIRKDNGIIQGEIDFDEPDFVNDTKANWDIFTYDAVKAKPVKPLYWWQGQGYMWLWLKKNFRLIYSLINTPEHLVALEIKKLEWDFIGTPEDWDALVEDVKRNHYYDDLPIQRKVWPIEFQFDESAPALIEARVKECRKFLNDLLNNKIALSDESDNSDGDEEMAA